MNDKIELPEPDDRLLAVSAVLDGTADAAEVALVEASSDAQSLLGELRSHQAALRSVAVPADAAPWSMSAALDIFDREGPRGQVAPDAEAASAGSSSVSGTVVPFRRRSSTSRVLTGMAAALVLVMVGVVAVGGLDGFGGSDSELSSSTESPLAALSDEGGADDEGSARAVPAESADSAMIDSATKSSSDQSSASSPASTAAPAATEAPAAVESFSIEAGGATAGMALSTPEELALYAAERSALVPLEGQTFRCVEGDDEALGAVRYAGVEAIVTRSRASSLVTVFDLRDCKVLATTNP